MKTAFLAVLLAVVFVAVSGQGAPPGCDLNVRNVSNVTEPFEGINLNYCQTNQMQCCSNAYFSARIAYFRQTLSEGLLEQIDNNGAVLDGINTGLREYIENHFIRRFQNLLELPIDITQNISTFDTSIRNRFYIRQSHQGEADFNLESFTEGFFQSQANFLTEFVLDPFFSRNNGSGSVLNTEQKLCIRRYLYNETTKNRIDRSVQVLREAVTSISRIRTWFDSTYRPSIRFTPLNACLRGFIHLHCEECVADIPRICRGVCNAGIYGCYAAIQNGLSGQFNVLWNVTDQLVRLAREAVRNVSDVLPHHLLKVNLANRQHLFAVIRGLAQDPCNIPLVIPTDYNSSSLPGPRQLDNDDVMAIPARILNDATNLLRRGLVNYGSNGPSYCRDFNNLNCWDGTREVPRYVPTFNSTSIAAQVNNPVLNLSISELRNQVNSYGNPVTDYLSSDSFHEVAPQQLVIPEDEPYTGGSSGLMVSTFLMVVLTIIYAAFA